MKIKKLLLGLILFSALIFTQNVSADTSLLQETMSSTDISSRTVKFKTLNDNQKDKSTINYKNTSAIYNEGPHKINKLATNTKNAYASAHFDDFSSNETNQQNLILTLIALMVIVAFTPIALMLFNR